tara:strand:- start:151 stop:1368 length:1218 start_codon:yes stop_codon:yes gene_type:complete
MGFFKKIFKPFKKIFKKIGKGIKKAFKKIGKWSGKLGVFGQIATMFIPGLGPMLGGLFKGLGQGALKLLQAGLQGGPLAKGAAWLVDTARIVGGRLTQGFSSLTKAATDFVGGTAKFLAKKIPGNPFGVEGMTGTYQESVLDVVGKNFTENFPGVEKTFNELMKGPEGRSQLIDTKLTEMNTVSLGGVDIDTRKLPDFTAQEAEQELAKINEAYLEKNPVFGKNSANAIDTYIKKYTAENSKNPFGDTLNFITDNPEYMNTLVQSTPEQMADWNKFMSGVEDATDPFKKTLKTTLGSLLSPKKALEDAPQRMLESYTTSALTNLVGGGAKQPEQPGPKATFAPIGAYSAMSQNQLLSQNVMTADPFLMGQSFVIPDGIIGEMSTGQQGGYFGNSFAFPGANFGFA